MDLFNYYGLGIMALIMLPNIIYAVKHKDLASPYKNKSMTAIEQIGRYGSFVFMIFNIPYTYYDFWFIDGKTVYIIMNAIAVVAYCAIWIILWNKSNLTKALLLSIIPSAIFVFSGILIASIPLLVFSALFAIAHIFISVKSVKNLQSHSMPDNIDKE